MRAHARTFAVFVLFASFVCFLSGCLGLHGQRTSPGGPNSGGLPDRTRGVIQGKVVDSSQVGIPGLLVQIQGTSITAVTDAQGLYVLNNVPSGTHTVVVEVPTPSIHPMSPKGTTGLETLTLDPEDNVPQLMLDGEPLSWSAAIEKEFLPETSTEKIQFQVHVEANTVTTAETVTIPVFGTVDNLFLYHASPRMGHALLAGDEITFHLDVHYSLQSFDEGFVVATFLLQDALGELHSIEQAYLHVEKGSGSVPLFKTVKIHTGRHLEIVLGLVNMQNNFLATKRYDIYPIIPQDTPIGPEISPAGFVDNHVIFEIYADPPYNFARYDLYVSRTSPSCNGHLAWTSDDPTVEIATAKPFSEGEPNYYQICLVTEQNGRFQHHRGEIVTYTVPYYGIEQLPLRRFISDLIDDPVRKRIYLADAAFNEIVVLSTVADEIERVIKVGQSPRGLAIAPDGSRLYVAHSGAKTVSVIDLTTDQVETIFEVGPRPMTLAIDAEHNRLYVGLPDGSNSKLLAIDLSTKHVLMERAFEDPVFARFDLIDDRLFVRTTFYTYILDPETLEDEVDTLMHDKGILSSPILIDETLYLPMSKYELDSFMQRTRLDFHPIAYDRDTHRLYALIPATSYLDPYSMVVGELIWDEKNGEWIELRRIPVVDAVAQSLSRVIFTDDDKRIYIPTVHPTDTIGLQVIDLPTRYNFTQP